MLQAGFVEVMDLTGNNIPDGVIKSSASICA